jgi:hypothetical protein
MKTLTLAALLLFAPVLVNAQTSEPDPRDTLIEALEGALKARDEVIVELKVELGKATQKGTDYEAVNLRLLALIDQLVKTHTKPKKFGLINF